MRNPFQVAKKAYESSILLQDEVLRGQALLNRVTHELSKTTVRRSYEGFICVFSGNGKFQSLQVTPSVNLGVSREELSVLLTEVVRSCQDAVEHEARRVMEKMKEEYHV